MVVLILALQTKYHVMCVMLHNLLFLNVIIYTYSKFGFHFSRQRSASVAAGGFVRKNRKNATAAKVNEIDSLGDTAGGHVCIECYFSEIKKKISGLKSD